MRTTLSIGIVFQPFKCMIEHDAINPSFLPRIGESIDASIYKAEIMKTVKIPKNLYDKIPDKFYVRSLYWETVQQGFVTIEVYPPDAMQAPLEKNYWNTIEWQDWLEARRIKK